MVMQIFALSYAFIEEKKEKVTKQLTANKSSIQHNKKENKEENKINF